MNISAAVAATELLARRRARNTLIGFTEYTHPTYQAEPAHELIASALEQVVDGLITRLMIFAPPQHGKSELVSVRLPAYWLGKRPNDPVAVASYAADLAQSKSREVRQIVEGDEYRVVFGDKSGLERSPVVTRRTSRAVNHWYLSEPYRGRMWAGGVGGPVTGHGFKLAIIDDPHENWEQAQSETMRTKVYEWWRGTFRPRVWGGGAIILVMTRWHDEDLAGKLLKEQGSQWTVLRLPALAETQADRDANNEYLGLPTGQPDPLNREPNEPLAPKRYSFSDLKEIQRDVGSLVWGSEYQGVPRALEGNRFKREWFTRRQKAVPQFVTGRVRYWDKAGTQDGGKYTAGVLISRSTEGHYYIEDVVRGQWSALAREEIMKQTAEQDAMKYGKFSVNIYVEQEPGSGGKESAESTVRNLAGFNIFTDLPSGSKDVRLEPFAAQAEAGNITLIEGTWNRDFIEEFIMIPNGSFRDQSDATSGAFNKLHEADTPEIKKYRFKW